MDKVLMQKQIAAAVLGQDQLVFTYKRDKVDPTTGLVDTKIVVRFVTPIELTADMVKCVQHLPEDGYRNFKLDNILNFHRVFTRGMPSTKVDSTTPATTPATVSVAG